VGRHCTWCSRLERTLADRRAKVPLMRALTRPARLLRWTDDVVLRGGRGRTWNEKVLATWSDESVAPVNYVEHSRARPHASCWVQPLVAMPPPPPLLSPPVLDSRSFRLNLVGESKTFPSADVFPEPGHNPDLILNSTCHQTVNMTALILNSNPNRNPKSNWTITLALNPNV